MEYPLSLILMDSFNFCCWNMRGINSPLKKQELVKTVARLHVSLCAVLETRVRHDKWDDFLVYCKKVWSMAMLGIFIRIKIAE